MSSRFHYAKFESEQDFLQAARSCRSHNLKVVEAYSPYPVHEIGEILGISRSKLPFVTLAGGTFGLGLAMFFQYWTSAVDWPINVGGKPFDSLPAFMPVAFEMLVLCAGLGTVAALFWRSRLYPGKNRKVPHPRISDDRFLLMVEVQDASLPPGFVEGLWQQHHAVEAWTRAGEVQ
ncbi:MAG: DUF3341 domain-containing protein [Planctomycetota bacterium]|nr:MAG: DUF3341 domain-containing protein [Planctomycetota bacterium]